MNENMIYLLLGFIIGGIAVWLSKRNSFTVLNKHIEQNERELSSLRKEMEKEKETRIAAETRLDEFEKQRIFIEKELSNTFASLSLEALSSNSSQFLRLAEEAFKSQTVEGKKELDGKKQLIDRSIVEIEKTLSEVQKKIEDVGKGNTEVSTLIRKHEEVTLKLKNTTEHLGQALASSKKRGEWGERMAEDIVRLVGMVEGVNYIKQKTLAGASGRPDFTFLLPNNLKINMDVKFPLDNYIHYLNAEREHEKKRYRDELMRNTKGMIKQVTTRDYINTAENTVDYVIIFIPNEQVYGFINETDSTIMDEALKQKVILCSPFTLYAVLAVIRQAIENFNLEKTASEILKLLAEFTKQWNSYKDKFRLMGDKLDAAKREYDTLTTTRANMLEKPLRKVDELRKQKNIGLEHVPFNEKSKLKEQSNLKTLKGGRYGGEDEP